MRPERLYALFKDVASIKGIGSRLRLYLERLTGARLIDLLWHLPSGIIDRRFRPKIDEAKPGQIATLEVTVEKHIKGRDKRVPYRVITGDETGKLTLVFFRGDEDYLLGKLPLDEKRIVSGRVERYGGKLQMTHPDHMVALDELDQLPIIEPVYPLTQGLTLKALAKAMRGALEILPDLPEWLDGPYLKKQQWPGWQEAVRLAHEPLAPADLDPLTPARARLAYDELLANGTILAYEVSFQYVHTEDPRYRYVWYIAPSADAVDKVNEAYTAVFEKEAPAIFAALSAVAIRSEHRDVFRRVLKYAHK